MLDFTFPGQREGEDVLAVINKHPVVYARIIAAFLVAILLPLIIFLIVWFNFYPLDTYYQGGMVIGVLSCIVLLYGLLFSCIKWINEEFDIFVLTTDRLIDITQITFLKRSVTSTPLEQIQDTTGIISGTIPTLFNYGDLTVQTAAGNASEFFIDRISDPEDVARKILDWADTKRRGETFANTDDLECENDPDDTP